MRITSANYGMGNLVEASLSKVALASAMVSINTNITPGMTWEDASKIVEASVKDVKYMTAEDAIEMLDKVASKGIKVSDDPAMQKEAQQWIGKGLNWLADKSKGVANWGQNQMQNAKAYQALQPHLNAIEQSIAFIKKNPQSAAGMMSQLSKQFGALGQAAGLVKQPQQANAPATPAQIPTPAQPAPNQYGVNTLPFGNTASKK